MVRRLAMFVPILMFLVSGLPAGGDNFPPRQMPVKAPAAPPGHAETVKAPSVTILSIIPAQGEPGTTVTLYGNGFTEKTSAFLANMEVPTVLAGPQQITFEIPKLDPGLYALFLKREDGMTSRAYNFSVLPLKPVVTSLDPDSVYSCATGHDREVTITGQNFKERSLVVFDGAAIRSRYSSPETISFTAPQVAGGLHQVQVKNSEDAVSGVLGLVIDARPEITSVSQGEGSVNYYNLIIEGRNFQQNSSVVVMEERSIEQSPSQSSFDVKRINSGMSSATEREQTIYVNCNRIIYRRNPYSNDPKNLRIQVVNPDGTESSVVSVSAP